MTQPDAPTNLDLEVYAGLKVVQSQQSEINRRLGNIEKSMDERIVDPNRVASLEEWREESSDTRKDWTTWIVQTIGSVIITSALVLLGGKFGVNISW